MEDKLKYLEMIQEIIKRMASNSFLLKGWSVTFASAIIEARVFYFSLYTGYCLLVSGFLLFTIGKKI